MLRIQNQNDSIEVSYNHYLIKWRNYEPTFQWNIEPYNYSWAQYLIKVSNSWNVVLPCFPNHLTSVGNHNCLERKSEYHLMKTKQDEINSRWNKLFHQWYAHNLPVVWYSEVTKYNLHFVNSVSMNLYLLYWIFCFDEPGLSQEWGKQPPYCSAWQADKQRKGK